MSVNNNVKNDYLEVKLDQVIGFFYEKAGVKPPGERNVFKWEFFLDPIREVVIFKMTSTPVAKD